LSVRSLSSKAILPPFSATKILVRTASLQSDHHLESAQISLLTDLNIAGLTVGDPVYRTGNPLSVELGPGK
jgi:hypothetical protein